MSIVALTLNPACADEGPFVVASGSLAGVPRDIYREDAQALYEQVSAEQERCM